MNTLSDSHWYAGDADHTDAALLLAIADMQPGWVVFRDCSLLDYVRGTRARVRYALLHPKIGIALLDVLPGATTPDALGRMRRLLDASDFRLAFGDYPPIVYLCVSSRTLSEIGPLLAREFDVLPPLELARRDAWAAAAKRALAAAAGQRLRVLGRMVDDGRSEPMELTRPERVERWSAPRQALGLRALGVFWGAVAMAFGGGALGLQYLGPPEPTAVIAHAGTGPERARVASEEAWLTSVLPGTARSSTPGPMLALWPVERMRTRFDAPRAGGAATLEPGDATDTGTRPDGLRSAPIDIVAAIRPPWSQVAAARMDAPSASVPRVGHNGGSEDLLPTEATRPPPSSETGSGAPETSSGSEGVAVGGSAPPATVGTAAGAGTAHAPGATAVDETPASLPGPPADAATAGARDAGPVAPLLPSLGGAAAPAQASVATAPPAGASEMPAAADVYDSRHADPQSARGPDGHGGADVRLPPAMESETASGASAPIEPARTPGASPAQEAIRAFVPPTADAHAADPAAVSAAETASPSATATADALPAIEPPAIPLTHAEPLFAPVQPAETAVPSTAAAASAAISAPRPQAPSPSGASPTAVAALLARGDALIAIGNVAAARLVYQRAAAHASARAATAAGKTYDPRFLQEIGAIGVVADPDAAAAWYSKGSALGDENATLLLDGLEVEASR